MREGLKLQTCGVLINFDMPWNPMRVEQRIGRIDRIGQKYEIIYVKNYFYEKSVEAVVYQRLEERISWFEAVVGALQPILTQVGKAIQDLSMAGPEGRQARLESQIRSLQEKIREQEISGLNFDLFVDLESEPDVEPVNPVPPEELELLFTDSQYLGKYFKKHPEIQNAYLLNKESKYIAVTFNPLVFDRYPETLRLLSFGEPLMTDLLKDIPDPDIGKDVEGRIMRCAVSDGGGGGYYCSVMDGVRRV